MPDLVPPQGQPEAPSVVPAAPAAASSLNPEAVHTERATQAKSPQAIRSLLSDLRKAPAIKAPEVTPAAPTPAPTADPAAAPAPEASEETPAPDADPAADPTPAPETEDDDDGGEDPIEPIAGAKTRLRLPENDKVGRMAASIMKRNRDLSMEEAIDRARNQLGIKPPTVAAPAPDAPPKSDLPATVDAVDAEQDRLFAERKKAYTELRFEDVNDIDLSLRKLDRHRLNLEREATTQQTRQAQEYDTSFTRNEQRAAELYEFASNPDSPGGKRMLEIDAALQENNDPLYSSPDKPLRIAQMVAAELKIAPRKKGQAAPAKPAAPAPVAPAQKKQVLPGGGSSTIPPASNPTTAVAEQAANVKTVHQLRQFLKPMLAKR